MWRSFSPFFRCNTQLYTEQMTVRLSGECEECVNCTKVCFFWQRILESRILKVAAVGGSKIPQAPHADKSWHTLTSSLLPPFSPLSTTSVGDFFRLSAFLRSAHTLRHSEVYSPRTNAPNTVCRCCPGRCGCRRRPDVRRRPHTPAFRPTPLHRQGKAGPVPRQAPPGTAHRQNHRRRRRSPHCWLCDVLPAHTVVPSVACPCARR